MEFLKKRLRWRCWYCCGDVGGVCSAPFPLQQGQQRGEDTGGAGDMEFTLPSSRHHEPGCKGTDDTQWVGGV